MENKTTEKEPRIFKVNYFNGKKKCTDIYIIAKGRITKIRDIYK